MAGEREVVEMLDCRFAIGDILHFSHCPMDFGDRDF